MIQLDLRMGDCLEVMSGLPTRSFDAIITDPPYSINTKSDGSGKISPWGDAVNAAFWYTEWIGSCRRILKDNGCLWTFLSWRSYVTFYKASCNLGWPIESVLVWEKGFMGAGGLRGLRPSYELVALWAMPGFAIPDRGVPDVWNVKASTTKPTGHPAEKPLALMQKLIEVTPCQNVLDPFMGSGTTGVAAAMLGKDFTGIEIDEGFFNMAKARIENANNQPGLFDENA